MDRYDLFIDNIRNAINVVDALPRSIPLREIPFHVACSKPFRATGMDPLQPASLDPLFGPQAREYLWSDRTDCVMDETMKRGMKWNDRELVKNRLRTRQSEYAFCLNMQRKLTQTVAKQVSSD